MVEGSNPKSYWHNALGIVLKTNQDAGWDSKCDCLCFFPGAPGVRSTYWEGRRLKKIS